MAFYVGNTKVAPILKSSSGGGEWGEITGDINDQLDLKDALNNKLEVETDPTVPQWAKQPTKPAYTAAEVGALPDTTVIPDKISDLVIDLGDIDMEEYGYDVWAWITSENLLETGLYKAHDTADGFYYFIKVEAINGMIFQEYWYTEEGALTKHIRSGWDDGGTIDWGEETSWLTSEEAYNNFALQGHTHYIEETINQQSVLTYLNSFSTNKSVGEYKIVNSNDRSISFVTFDWRYISGGYQFYQKWITNSYSGIRIRFGRKAGGSSIVWENWRDYLPYSDLEGNFYTTDYIDDNYYTKDDVDELIGGGVSSNNMIETTWANLVSLRDNAQLVKGAWYRITDYEFVTTSIGIKSAGHRFDIVLLAISESMLSESGYACRNADDHYFEREITIGGIEWLYTMYADDYASNYGNEPVDHADDLHAVDQFCDSDVMTHPVTGDDVPVLYKTNTEDYSIDEPDYDDVFFYEGTYDFDGDEYDMWSKYERSDDGNEWVFMQQYALTPIVVENGELTVSPIPENKIVPVNMNAWELKYCLDNDKDLFGWAVTEGKGVIYYLKDEFGNEAPYDFKNVMFERRNITSAESTVSALTLGENSHLGKDGNYAITCGTDRYYYYTFDTPYNAGNDSSLFGDSAYNVIKPYILEGKRLINNIVLGVANNNMIGNNCYDLTLWGPVQNNVFKHTCYNILCIGISGVVAENMKTSTFYQIGSVVFGNGSWNNVANQFSDSDIGRGCYDNDFGVGNMGLTIGSSFQKNKFGRYCYSDSFDSGVTNCVFGNYVSYNKFEKLATNITLPNYTRYCKFETGVSNIKFNTSGGNNSNYIQYVTVCSGISNLTAAPSRASSYEQIYYKNGRMETAV